MKYVLIVLMMCVAGVANAGDRFNNNITERVLTEVVIGQVLANTGLNGRVLNGIGVRTGNQQIDQMLDRNVQTKVGINRGANCFTKIIYRGGQPEPAMVCN